MTDFETELATQLPLLLNRFEYFSNQKFDKLTSEIDLQIENEEFGKRKTEDDLKEMKRDHKTRGSDMKWKRGRLEEYDKELKGLDQQKAKIEKEKERINEIFVGLKGSGDPNFFFVVSFL